MKLTFDAAPEQYRNRSDMRLVMSSRDGVSLDLRDTNQESGWLGHAMESLGDEIKLGVPRWAFARKFWARNTYVSIAGAIGIFAVFAADPTANAWLAATVGGVVGYSVGFASGSILLRNLPPLEVVQPGATNKGRRTFGILGAVALNLLTVAAGLVYSAIHSKK